MLDSIIHKPTFRFTSQKPKPAPLQNPSICFFILRVSLSLKAIMSSSSVNLKAVPGRLTSSYSEVQASRLDVSLPLPSVLKSSFSVVDGPKSSAAGNPGPSLMFYQLFMHIIYQLLHKLCLIVYVIWALCMYVRLAYVYDRRLSGWFTCYLRLSSFILKTQLLQLLKNTC